MDQLIPVASASAPAPAPPVALRSLSETLYSPLAPHQQCESSECSSEVLFTPQVKNDLIPKIAQEFANLEDAHTFYNNYAKESGFGTRRSSSKRSRDTGEVIRKEFCCDKEGDSAPKTNEVSVRRRGKTRDFCCAKLCVVLDKSGGNFVVSKFVEGHTHPLTTPKRVHLIRSHRKVSLAKKTLTAQLAAANVPPCQQMSFLEVQSGGLENVGFLQQDLYNMNLARRKSLEGHDANMLYEHFQIEQQKNPGFMFTIEKDDEGRMTHCFWVDATSRKAYSHFGDVVVFDTTYNTNRYSMIFTPFVGVNHHGQTTLFGCAFLGDEKSDSFEWLFKEWLKAMPGGKPKMIITDQDPAMTKAIASVFGTSTYHRYCIWHILSKFSEKISAISYKNHYEEFKNCIWNSESPEEFEATWGVAVENANLSSNEWLKQMYEIRDKWIPAYMRHVFSAHMTSSQRAESNHAFFKKYVSSNNSLLDFVTRFDRALSRLRHNELDLDHKDVNEKPPLKTMFAMEETMSELYTRTIFYKFQDELFQCMAYVVMLSDEEEDVYIVKRVKYNGPRVRKVVVDKPSGNVSCSCKKFESDGILCRHILAYFNKRIQVLELPHQYILRRWTKSAKAMRVLNDLGGGVKQICDTSLSIRRTTLFHETSDVIDDAASSEEGTVIYRQGLESIKIKLKELKLESEVCEASTTRVPLLIEHGVKEPLQVRAKGCGKRLKGGKEKAVKMGRFCHGCQKHGQTHDKRNCPELQKSSLQGTGSVDDDDDEEEEEQEDDDIE